MKTFQDAANPSLEQFREQCSGSYKDMMVHLGIFTPNESALISERQVVMAAMVLALNDGVRPTLEVMGNNGQVDLMKVVALDQTVLFKTMEEMNIDKETMERARVFVEDASLCDIHNFCDVPMIGRLHSEYLGRPDIVQAALALQHSVRASNIIYRLQNGEADKEDHYNRREFSYADLQEDQRLEDALGFHYEVSKIERDEGVPGQPLDMFAHYEGIRKSFATSLTLFDEAARGESYTGVSPKLMKLTDRVQDLANHCLHRIGANEPMDFDLGPELTREGHDPLTDPNLKLPRFLTRDRDDGLEREH